MHHSQLTFRFGTTKVCYFAGEITFIPLNYMHINQPVVLVFN